jgi:hypothetical protein
MRLGFHKSYNPKRNGLINWSHEKNLGVEFEFSYMIKTFTTFKVFSSLYTYSYSPNRCSPFFNPLIDCTHSLS